MECSIPCCTAWKTKAGSAPGGGTQGMGANGSITRSKKMGSGRSGNNAHSGRPSIPSWPAFGRSNMFELEDTIAKWRAQMVAAGLKQAGVLDELESHLRDDIEQRMRAGLA